MWAINPEAGYFGVAPGTTAKTNPNALAMLDRDAIFTNVGVTADGQPWWEGLPGTAVKDWKGQPYDPAVGPAAHPNARFTVSARQCPSYSPRAEDAQGVPLSAIVVGGRRASLVPLVFQARDWAHGVLVGAGMGSETTAAATGAVGVLRRDSMAMKPFCGYNFADYFAHWLSFDRPGAKLPGIFHVNWFRKGDDGRFLWPGFGDNLRVLEWIIGRVTGEAGAVETPIGLLPATTDLDLEGLSIDAAHVEALLAVDRAGWAAEMDSMAEYFEEFGARLPARLEAERARVAAALAS
jgi:phosphoenolpyruvate carboxykinase (GTP)